MSPGQFQEHFHVLLTQFLHINRAILFITHAFLIHHFHNLHKLPTAFPYTTCTLFSTTCTISIYFLHHSHILLAPFSYTSCTIPIYYLHHFHILLAAFPYTTCTISIYFLHHSHILNPQVNISIDYLPHSQLQLTPFSLLLFY